MRRTILSALVMVFALGFTAQASAAEPADKLAGTNWKHTDPRNGSELKFEFTQNGLFTFIVKDAKETQTVKGIYSIVDNKLRLKVFNQGMFEMIEIGIVEQDDNKLVTRLDNAEREFSRVR